MDRVPMRELSVDELPMRRAVICALTKVGHTPQEIEKQCLCSPTARRSAVKAYKTNGHHFDMPRSGRPAKHSPRDKRELERMINTGDAKSAAEATHIINSTRPKEDQLSSSTVRAILANYKPKGRAKTRKPATKKTL